MGRASYLGTDLSDDHPVSFAYTSQLAEANGELKLPVDLPSAIKLEDGLNLQCTSCHNPHSDPYGKFLVMDNSASQLCTACHTKTGWTVSSHAAVTLAGVTGCLNCHDTHGAGGAQRLLKTAAEEGTCLSCHKGGSGVIGAVDIQTPFQKSSNHPVEAVVGVHDPLEDLPVAEFHVECADCHNPHQLNDATAVAPLVNGRLKGVKGITINGEVTSGYAQYEYEVCFRCHSDNSFVMTNTVTRHIEEGNKRLCFSPENPSYHAVAAPGKALSVTSLKTPYTPSSMIYCTDCHNSDSSVIAGGTGANGPHGSENSPLLIARYETSYPQPYAIENYALCFRCHDVSKIMSASDSTFKNHNQHVNMKQIPCSVCHDPHGIPLVAGGNTTNNAHLINFDRTVVASGTYDSVARSCTVSCHMNQAPKSY
jgi:predicted CXXCH cytochrome family protein